jgi:hypothetical protein
VSRGREDVEYLDVEDLPSLTRALGATAAPPRGAREHPRRLADRLPGLSDDIVRVAV